VAARPCGADQRRGRPVAAPARCARRCRSPGRMPAGRFQALAGRGRRHGDGGGVRGDALPRGAWRPRAHPRCARGLGDPHQPEAVLRALRAGRPPTGPAREGSRPSDRGGTHGQRRPCLCVHAKLASFAGDPKVPGRGPLHPPPKSGGPSGRPLRLRQRGRAWRGCGASARRSAPDRRPAALGRGGDLRGRRRSWRGLGSWSRWAWATRRCRRRRPARWPVCSTFRGRACRPSPRRR